MTKNRLLTFGLGFTLVAAAGAADARETIGSHPAHTAQAVSATQTQDDTWAVIEYPEGREVVVELMPTAATSPDARGTARVVRAANETTISLDTTGLPGDASSYQVYAVDSLGNATVLGTLPVTGGAGSVSINTPLNRFMLLLSPDPDLTGFGPETVVTLRSAVPSGFAAIPRAPSGGVTESAEGAVAPPSPEAASTDSSDYEAPLLNINSLKRGSDSQMRTMFASGSDGARAEVTLKPRKNGSTEIRVRFQGLKQAGDGSRYILWAVAPDNSYALLGQLSPTGKLGETGVKAETTLRDFGLFVTAEGAEVTPSSPAGELVATVVR